MKTIKDENTLIKERIIKLNAIIEKGINPYPYSFKKTNSAKDLHEKFDSLKPEEHTKTKVSIAGRIKTLRVMGKVSFLDIEDGSGKIQLYFNANNLNNYKLIKKIENGDWIGVKGLIFKTRTGELTVDVKKFEILSKAIRPLPSNWYGLKDPEVRYRRRELDLIMNQDVKEIFIMRTKAMKYLREFLDKKGFMEVETPLLQPVYGGANAKPFTTKLNALDMKLYLSIAPELYLKRLIIGGFEKVYTICKNFRNEGIDKSHNPEFTMMECYAAYWDYNDVMKLTEQMYAYVFKKVIGKTKIDYEGKILDFTPPWKRLTMYGAVKNYTGINVEKLSKEEILKRIKEKNLKVDNIKTKGLIVMELFEEYCEEKIIQPTFIIDQPKESSPLCKVHRKNPDLIERFEPFANGMEIGNAYSELNDPFVQRKHFEEQKKLLKEAGNPHPLDEGFLEALEQGMPPTGGLGIGFDRMVMFLTSKHSIRDVILFPFMKQ